MVLNTRVEELAGDQVRIWVTVDCGTVLGEPYVAETLVFSGPSEQAARIDMGLHVYWAKHEGKGP